MQTDALDQTWLVLQRNDGLWPLAGLAAAVLSMVTVYSTAMIYRSLAAIPRWHHPLVAPVYLILALATGAMWLNAVLASFVTNHGGHALTQAICFAAVAAAWLLKIAYWRAIDGATGAGSAASAIGLGGLKGLEKVRPLDPPHVQDNYLLKEMGFTIARKHAAKLRRLTHLTAFLLPGKPPDPDRHTGHRLRSAKFAGGGPGGGVHEFWRGH